MPDIASLVPKAPLPDDNLSSIRLPIVDIGPYLDPSSSTEARKATASSIDKACREFGFLYVTGHGIPKQRLDDLLELGHKFFALSQDAKDSIHIAKSMDGVRGYQKIGENVTYAKRDQQEAIDIYPEPETPTTDQLNGSQLWPSEDMVPGLKAAVLEHSETMKKIGLAFMQAMSDAFGHEDVWKQLSEDNYWSVFPWTLNNADM
jgi:isopenicillin N synthase-like dioxygenase